MSKDRYDKLQPYRAIAMDDPPGILICPEPVVASEADIAAVNMYRTAILRGVSKRQTDRLKRKHRRSKRIIQGGQ